MKSYVHLGLTEEEMRAYLDFAGKEEIDIGTAIKWCAKEGLKSFNGGHAQAHLPRTPIPGKGRKEE